MGEGAVLALRWQLFVWGSPPPSQTPQGSPSDGVPLCPPPSHGAPPAVWAPPVPPLCSVLLGYPTVAPLLRSVFVPLLILGHPVPPPCVPPPIPPHSLSFHCLWLRPPHRDPHDPPPVWGSLYTPPSLPDPTVGFPTFPPPPLRTPLTCRTPPTPTQLPSPPPHEPQGGSACTPLSLRGGNTGTGGAPRDPKPPSLSPRGSQGRGYGDGPIEGTRWPSCVLVPLAL